MNLKQEVIEIIEDWEEDVKCSRCDSQSSVAFNLTRKLFLCQKCLQSYPLEHNVLLQNLLDSNHYLATFTKQANQIIDKFAHGLEQVIKELAQVKSSAIKFAELKVEQQMQTLKAGIDGWVKKHDSVKKNNKMLPQFYLQLLAWREHYQEMQAQVLERTTKYCYRFVSQKIKPILQKTCRASESQQLLHPNIQKPNNFASFPSQAQGRLPFVSISDPVIRCIQVISPNIYAAGGVGLFVLFNMEKQQGNKTELPIIIGQLHKLNDRQLVASCLRTKDFYKIELPAVELLRYFQVRTVRFQYISNFIVDKEGDLLYGQKAQGAIYKYFKSGEKRLIVDKLQQQLEGFVELKGLLYTLSTRGKIAIYNNRQLVYNIQCCAGIYFGRLRPIVLSKRGVLVADSTNNRLIELVDEGGKITASSITLERNSYSKRMLSMRQIPEGLLFVSLCKKYIGVAKINA